MRPLEQRVRRLIGNAPSWYRRALAWRSDAAGLFVGDDVKVAAIAEQLASDRLPLVARVALYEAVVRALSAQDAPRAVAFGERYLDAVAGASRARAALAGAHAAQGAILRPLELLAEGAQSSRRIARLQQQARLLQQGVTLSAPAAAPAYEAKPRRVLYYVASSLPHHGSGYAIRTQALMKALGARGWDMHVVARAGYPNDRWDCPTLSLAAPEANVDGVPYYFAPQNAKMQYTRDIERYQRHSVEELIARCRVLRPAVIHAASNYTCGLAAAEAGARLGIPVVYEMRGLWHVTKTATQPDYLDSDHFRMIEGLEAQAARAANHVFAITSGVRDVLLRRDINSQRISLLPNAVDVAGFVPMAPDASLAAEHGLTGKLVIGYIGSLLHYEGLDYLLRAAALLRQTLGDTFRVLIVGSGAVAPELAAQAQALGLQDVVVFTGRVPFAKTRNYYSIMDVVALPRRGTPVCEIVSPLKPFEAMAMNLPIVASDVGALADIVKHEVTGLLHRKDDVNSLAAQLRQLLENPELRHTLGHAAGAWVHQAHTWDALADQVALQYDAILK